MVAVEIPIGLRALALRGVLQEVPLPHLQDTGLENWTRTKPDILVSVGSDGKEAILPDFGCWGSSKEICGLPECSLHYRVPQKKCLIAKFDFWVLIETVCSLV